MATGEFTGSYSGSRHGFLYRFTCTRCGLSFTETTEEVSEPSLCHGCISGTHRDDRGHRGMETKAVSSGRKGRRVRDE